MMPRFTTIPCYYLPTTLVFVDDTPVFIENLRIQLFALLPRIIFFSSPAEGLAFLRQYTPDHSVDNCLSYFSNVELDDDGEHAVIFFDHLKNRPYDKKRFEEIGVVVVDQLMPQLSGIELCRQVRHHPFKMMILTGLSEQKLAIDAFNEGVIDRYVNKNDVSDAETLQEIVESLVGQYFIKRSEVLLHNISIKRGILQEPAYIDLFHYVLEKYRIVEFYMANADGHFLLLNAEGHLYRLVIQSEKETEYWYHVATTQALSGEILRSFINREKIFFHSDEEAWPETEEAWHAHLYPATPLSCSLGQFFYAVIPLAPSRDPEKQIFPFCDFMQHRKTE